MVPNNQSSTFFAVFGYTLIGISFISTTADGILFAFLIRYRHFLGTVMPDKSSMMSPIIRLTILSCTRLFITASELVEQILSDRTTAVGLRLQIANKWMERLFPAIIAVIFCQPDMFKVWFPCLFRSKSQEDVNENDTELYTT